MALSPDQVDQLLKMIQLTREVEMTCPECLDELDKYTQGVLNGEELSGALGRVRDHLETCPFCNDEFQLILETLRAMDE